MKTTLLLFFLSILFFPVFSQEKVKLHIHLPNEFKSSKTSKSLNYQTKHQDSLSAIKELNRVVSWFQRQSYILVSTDSLKLQSDSLIAFIDPGLSFKWAELKGGNVNDLLLSRVGFKERYYLNNLFNYKELADLQEAFLNYSDRHGHPFARIGLDSIEIFDDSKIKASINYQSGPIIRFDSIEIIGKVKVKKKFLLSYLRIFPGTLYNQDKVDNINRLLRELTFLKQSRPYVIVFSQEKAIVKLFLEEKRTNQIDGIIGLLPNTAANKKLLVTGELNIRLRNLFNSGKYFAGEWRRFNQASQILNLSYLHPRLLKSNLDLKLDFNLFKQDSTFITIDRKITLYQKAGKLGVINFSGGLKTSRELISNKIVNASSLPLYSNYNFQNYGLGYDWNNLDDIFFPHRGWLISGQLVGGNKNIRKSSAFPDSLYNNIKLNSVQLNGAFLLNRYSPVGRKSVLVLSIQGAKLVNDKRNIFYNDLYRVGGLKSLRGFAENFYYASSYALGTLEYRFFTDETSYLLLFVDQAYIKNILNTTTPVDLPTGFGAGVSFSTGVGVFNFVYSLGRSKSQQINLNQSKIHFGIISRF